jgi:predicted ester cyclase
VIALLIEEMKLLERRYYDECNKGKDAAIAMLDKLFASDVVWHSASGQDLEGLENLKQSFKKAYDTFPDTHYTVEDVIVEGDRAVTRFTFAGTHRVDLEEIDLMSRKVKTWGIRIACIVDGLFVEIWERYDTFGWMQELGIVPKPKQTG